MLPLPSLTRCLTQFDLRKFRVVLDPDVAKVFQSSDVVNALLRSIISAMPSPDRKSQVDNG